MTKNQEAKISQILNNGMSGVDGLRKGGVLTRLEIIEGGRSVLLIASICTIIGKNNQVVRHEHILVSIGQRGAIRKDSSSVDYISLEVALEFHPAIQTASIPLTEAEQITSIREVMEMDLEHAGRALEIISGKNEAEAEAEQTNEMMVKLTEARRQIIALQEELSEVKKERDSWEASARGAGQELADLRALWAEQEKAF